MPSRQKNLTIDSDYSTLIAIVSERGSGRRGATVWLPYQLADSEVDRFAKLFGELVALGPDGVEEAIALYYQRATWHP